MRGLLHVNGLPGSGKSVATTLAVRESPGVLNLDIDVLRTFLVGWDADFAGVGALMRPIAGAMIEAHVAGGGLVAAPQLMTDGAELALFHDRARRGGGDVVHVVLLVDPAVAYARVAARAVGPSAGALDRIVLSAVDELGGVAGLERMDGELRELAASDGARSIDCDGATIEEVAQELRTTIARG
jgi:hypothetical protein